jgi:hypothetical protein
MLLFLNHCGSPYLSIKSLCKSLVGGFVGSLVLERFNNRAEITSVLSPLLVIHGVEDTLIPCQHGETLYHESPAAASHKRLLLCEGADHNNFDSVNHVRNPIAQFITDLVMPSLQAADSTHSLSIPDQYNDHRLPDTHQPSTVVSWFRGAASSVAAVSCSLFEVSGGAASSCFTTTERVDATTGTTTVTSTSTTAPEPEPEPSVTAPIYDAPMESTTDHANEPKL